MVISYKGFERCSLGVTINIITYPTDLKSDHGVKSHRVKASETVKISFQIRLEYLSFFLGGLSFLLRHTNLKLYDLLLLPSNIPSRWNGLSPSLSPCEKRGFEESRLVARGKKTRSAKAKAGVSDTLGGQPPQYPNGRNQWFLDLLLAALNEDLEFFLKIDLWNWNITSSHRIYIYVYIYRDEIWLDFLKVCVP